MCDTVNAQGLTAAGSAEKPHVQSVNKHFLKCFILGFVVEGLHSTESESVSNLKGHILRKIHFISVF